MADDVLTMTELATINDARLKPKDISDLVQAAPLIARLPADTTDGSSYLYTKESGAPTVGFRTEYVGRTYDHSEDTLVTVTLKFLDASFHIDKMVADQYKNGPMAYVEREAMRHLKAGLYAFESQVIRGTNSSYSGGFNGFEQAITALSDTMCVNAAGSTALTSAWMVYADVDRGLHTVVGNKGVITMGETVLQQVDDSSGNHFWAYATPLDMWGGCVTGGTYTIGRIANIGTDSGKGLTDDLLGEMYSAFPVDRRPNLIVMNRRSRKQLQQSRTATNATGTPAPFPTVWDGGDYPIPIVVVEAIGNAETALT